MATPTEITAWAGGAVLVIGALTKAVVEIINAFHKLGERIATVSSEIQQAAKEREDARRATVAATEVVSQKMDVATGRLNHIAEKTSNIEGHVNGASTGSAVKVDELTRELAHMHTINAAQLNTINLMAQSLGTQVVVAKTTPVAAGRRQSDTSVALVTPLSGETKT